MVKSKSKAAYMISAVAERYEIHPQTLRLYEREGLLAPSRSDGNTPLPRPASTAAPTAAQSGSATRRRLKPSASARIWHQRSERVT